MLQELLRSEGRHTGGFLYFECEVISRASIFAETCIMLCQPARGQKRHEFLRVAEHTYWGSYNCNVKLEQSDISQLQGIVGIKRRSQAKRDLKTGENLEGLSRRWFIRAHGGPQGRRYHGGHYLLASYQGPLYRNCLRVGGWRRHRAKQPVSRNQGCNARMHQMNVR